MSDILITLVLVLALYELLKDFWTTTYTASKPKEDYVSDLDMQKLEQELSNLPAVKPLGQKY